MDGEDEDKYNKILKSNYFKLKRVDIQSEFIIHFKIRIFLHVIYDKRQKG